MASVADLASIENFRKYLQTTLGGFGGADVELNSQHLDAAIRDSVDCLNRYMPGLRGFKINYTSSVHRYELDLTQAPGFIDVVSVQFVKPELTNGGMLLENPFRLDTVIGLGSGTVTLGYADFALGTSRIKEGRRIFSIDPQWDGYWEVIPSTNPSDPPGTMVRVFALYLDMPDPALALGFDATVYYSYSYEASDDPLNGIITIPAPRHLWIKKYAVAKAKETLGRIRGKFLGVPGPDEGSIIQMDGADLIREAQESISSLENELIRMRGQTPPLLS